MNPFMQMVQRSRAPKKHPLSVGSTMQRGEGQSYREGSLGAALSLSNDNLIFFAIGGILGIVAVKQGWVKKGFLGT